MDEKSEGLKNKEHLLKMLLCFDLAFERKNKELQMRWVSDTEP